MLFKQLLINYNFRADNVLLEDMKLCPFYWPEKDKCAWINFSLPIILEPNQTEWTGYQLTRKNLEIMWNKYAEKYLDQIGLKPYVKPDDDFVMLIWSSIMAGVIAGFIIILFIVRCLMIGLTRKEKYKVFQFKFNLNLSLFTILEENIVIQIR